MTQNMMYRALVKRRDEVGGDFHPVFMHGDPFYADYATMVQMISAMSQNFPNLEYRMEAMDDIKD